MKKIILLLIFIQLLFGCKKREDSIRWNIDGVIPVAHGELSIFDILPDSILVTNGDSTVNLNIDLNLFTLDMDTLVGLRDTSIKDTFALPYPIPITAPPGQVFINQPEDNMINIGDAEITLIKTKNGTVNYELISTIKGKIIYEYQIPVAIDANGNSFSQLVYVDAASAGNYATASGSFDLTGYTIDLTGSTGNSYNTIQTNVNIRVDPSNGSDVTASNLDTVYIFNELSNVSIDYAKGYFGNETFVEGPSKEKITAFNKLISGNIDIDQITVDLDLVNGIGADASFTIDLISASKNATELLLSHSIIGSNINLNRAYEIGSTIYPYTYSTTFNTSNSNIDYLLELLPDSIGYGVSMELNPLGNVSAHNDFISSEAPLELNLGVDMPLSIIASNLTLADTIDLSIGDTTNVNSIQLNISIENGFPMEAQLDLALLDQNDMIVEHLFSPNLISSANTNSNGIVTSSNISEHLITLGEKDFNTLLQNKKIVLRIIFNTPSSGNHIDIYDYYKLKFNVGAELNYGIEIE